MDFAASSYGAAIGNGGALPEGLGAIFDTTTQARLVAMSRTTFTVHETGGFIAMLPEATCKAASFYALKTFMAVLAQQPILLAQLAACEALACACEEDAEHVRQSVVDLLRPGTTYTPDQVKFAIAHLHAVEGGDVQQPAEITRARGLVKAEVSTPRARAPAECLPRQTMMEFAEIITVDLPAMPMLGDSPFFKNLTELHSLALQMEEILFDNFMFHTELLTRLSVDITSKKPAITLANAENTDKLVFAGAVSFGDKPKATSCTYV